MFKINSKTGLVFAKREIQTGFTLIELMVTLTIMAVVMTVLLKSSAGQQDRLRYNQTVDRVERIKKAIVDVSNVNGTPMISGFVADMGRLPANIHELLEKDYCPSDITALIPSSIPNNPPSCATGESPFVNTTWHAQIICSDGTPLNGLASTCTGNAPTSLSVVLNAGWNGPYAQTFARPSHVDNQSIPPGPGSDAFTDGWGNEGYNPPLGYPNNRLNPDPRHNYGWFFSNTYADSSGTVQAGVVLYSYGNGCYHDSSFCKGKNATPDIQDFSYPASASPPNKAFVYDAANGLAVTPDANLTDAALLPLPPPPIVNASQWQIAIGDSVNGAGTGVNVSLVANLNCVPPPTGTPPQCATAGLPANCSYQNATSLSQCTLLGGIINPNKNLCLNMYYINNGNLSVVSSHTANSGYINTSIKEDGSQQNIHFSFPLPSSNQPITLAAGNAAFSLHEGPCSSVTSQPPPTPPNGTLSPTYPSGRQAVAVKILPGQTPYFVW